MGTLFTSTLPLGVIVITGPPPHEPSLRRTSVKYSPTIASSGDQVNHKRVCAINPRAILHEAFISKYSVSATYKLVDVRLVSCSVFLGNEIGINLQI